MKKILCKVLVLALVLCMVLPQTVMAATYNVSVSVELEGDSTKKVTENLGYVADTTLLVDAVAQALIAKEADLDAKFDTGLNAVVEAAKAAYQSSDAADWTAFVEGFESSYTAEADLKAYIADKTNTVGALAAGTYAMTYNNDAIGEVYVVTLTSTRLGGNGGKVPSGSAPTPPAAEEEKCACADYADVAKTAWYHTAVCAAVEKGIMIGVAEGVFAPEAKLTRAQLMTMLAREAGVDTEGGNPWYAKGMEWAVEQGISDGSAPEADITREQLVTMLYRAAKNEGKSVVAASDLANFSDAADVSDWALDAVKWAAATGVMKGSDGALNPQGTATRAEVAQFFANYASLA